jgi:hypothetical protein
MENKIERLQAKVYYLEGLLMLNQEEKKELNQVHILQVGSHGHEGRFPDNFGTQDLERLAASFREQSKNLGYVSIVTNSIVDAAAPEMSGLTHPEDENCEEVFVKFWTGLTGKEVIVATDAGDSRYRGKVKVLNMNLWEVHTFG